MFRYLPPFLRFPSAAAFFVVALAISGSGCSNQYRHLQRTRSGDECVQAMRPEISRALYKTSVDVLGHHLSGILLMRRMPDSSVRLVFGNETGFGFFNFGFSVRDSFTVYSVIPQLNRKAVIKTLRKDFELILFRHMDRAGRFVLLDSGKRFYGYPQSKGVNYYITDTACRQLLKMQRASRHKPVMEAVMTFDSQKQPDTISIRHLNFAFHIELKKIDQGE